MIISVHYYKIVYKKNCENNYDLVLPISKRDLSFFLQNKIFYERFLNFSNLVIISSSGAKELIKNEKSIIFVNENNLVSKDKIILFLKETRNITIYHAGWYEQQFLKMSYARLCKNDYYLIWDADTIPIKHINMFKNGIPIFDMKTEHHIPYFNTMKRLIPGLKNANRSYISEHMLIKTEFMKKLLDRIEMNSNLSGKYFWQKIFMAIDLKNINESGFSEYETYGSFVDTMYPNYYIHRNWYSIRDTTSFFGKPENLNENDIIWLSQDYDALSFEKWAIFNKKKLEIVKNLVIQKKIKPKRLFINFNYIFKNYKRICKLIS